MSSRTRILQVSGTLESVLLHTGREDFVFSPEQGLEGLLNIHKALLETVLPNRTQIRYLLYSPIWASGSTPFFGIEARPSSCAVAAMDDRLIVTKNYHASDALPEIYVIDHQDILTVELGKAGLLGWLRIRFAYGGKSEEVSVLFGATSGLCHFASAFGVYVNQLDPHLEGEPLEMIHPAVALFFPASASDVLAEIEKKEVSWEERRFWRAARTCLSPRLRILIECRGLIVVEQKTDSVMDATHLLLIPYGQIRGRHFRRREMSRRLLIEAALSIGQEHLTRFSVLFDIAQTKEAKLLENFLKKVLDRKGGAHPREFHSRFHSMKEHDDAIDSCDFSP